MTRRFFVTGTDTGVGKTVVSALLCAALNALYWKPIQTGTDEGTDREAVMHIAEIPESQTLPEAYTFPPPVSPNLAAARAGVKIKMEKLAIPEEAAKKSIVVEGAGGVLVPINAKQFMLDLIANLKLPVILAARSSLGTINHSLLSLAALESAGVSVRGVVLIGDPNRDNREAIEKYGHTKVVGEIPQLSALNRKSLLRTYETHFDARAFAE
jgi:dethiobiotin synthetase